MASHLERDRLLYQTLELPEGAGVEEVRRAYRLLAVKHHPDKNPGNLEASETFKAINTAHQVLTDPQRKAAYDKGPPGPTESTRAWAQSAYRDSSLSELERRRREREQEMLRRRAARDPVRQGQERRGSGMPESQRDFWRAKDKEREQELSARVRREKEQQRERELERAKEGEAARRRAAQAEDAAVRAASRAREKEREREQQQAAEADRRQRLEAERLRQEDARKREIDRQIARHHRQAEQAREARLKEQQRKFVAAQQSEREGVERAELRQRREGVESAESQLRAQLRRGFASGRTECRHRAERAACADDEQMRRLILVRQGENERRVAAVCSWESHARARLRAEQRTRRSDWAFAFNAARRFWEDAYAQRRLCYQRWAEGAASIAAADHTARRLLCAVRDEMRGRARVAVDHIVALHEATDSYHQRRTAVDARDRERLREQDRRVRLAADEKQQRAALLERCGHLSVLAAESCGRRGLLQGECAARADAERGRDAAVRQSEQRRRDAELDQGLERIAELEQEVAEGRTHLAVLRAELTRLAQAAELAQRQGSRGERRAVVLEAENATLRTELEELRAAAGRGAADSALAQENARLRAELAALRQRPAAQGREEQSGTSSSGQSTPLSAPQQRGRRRTSSPATHPVGPISRIPSTGAAQGRSSAATPRGGVAGGLRSRSPRTGAPQQRSASAQRGGASGCRSPQISHSGRSAAAQRRHTHGGDDVLNRSAPLLATRRPSDPAVLSPRAPSAAEMTEDTFHEIEEDCVLQQGAETVVVSGVPACAGESDSVLAQLGIASPVSVPALSADAPAWVRRVATPFHTPRTPRQEVRCARDP